MKDLTGKIINNFKVLRYIPIDQRQNSYEQWEVECLLCGKMVRRTWQKIEKAKSCGCRICPICKEGAHKEETCGKVDSNLSSKDRNNALTSLNGKNHKERRRKATRSYREKHPERIREFAKQSNERLRLEALKAYGGICECCGWNDLTTKLYGRTFLCIDHIDGGGRQHRKQVGNIYQWLKNNNYPNGFRVLCAGCNSAMVPGEKKCLLHKKSVFAK